MKKLTTIVGLMAIASVAASAAPVRTSKPVTLSNTQMATVKGEGIITIWVWTHFWGVWIPDETGGGHWEGGYDYYVLSQTVNTGPGGPGFTHVLGGPSAGLYGEGYIPSNN